MHLRRDGEVLELEDRWHDEIVCPRVAVDLHQFTAQLLAEGKNWLQLAEDAFALLAAGGYQQYPEDKVHVLRTNLSPVGLAEHISRLEAAFRVFGGPQ